MKKNSFKKEIAIGIIFLFLIASITPLVVGEKINNISSDKVTKNKLKVESQINNDSLNNYQYYEILYPEFDYYEMMHPAWDEFHSLHDCGAWPGWDNGYEWGDLYSTKIWTDHGVALSGGSGGSQQAWHIINWTCPEEYYYTFTFNYDTWGSGKLLGMSAWGDGQGLRLDLTIKGLNSYPPSNPFYEYSRKVFHRSQEGWPIPFLPPLPQSKSYNINTPTEEISTPPILIEAGDKCFSALINAISYVAAAMGSGSVRSTEWGRLNYIEIESVDPISPILRVAGNPPSYDFGPNYRFGNINHTFNIWNGGIGILYWIVSCDEDWIEIMPSSGMSSGEIDSVLITINTTKLSVGHHSANLAIHSNVGTKTGIIEIEILNIPPVADGNGPYYVDSYEDTVNFDASDSFDPDGDIVSYGWDFENDGNWEWYSSPFAEYKYPSDGMWLAKLQVIDSDGNISTDICAAHVGYDWEKDMVTMSEGWVSLDSSIAIDSNNYPHIAYTDYENFKLCYVYWDGDNWIFHKNICPGPQGHNPYVIDMELDSDGIPHIIFVRSGGCAIYYAHWTGSDWDIEPVYTTNCQEYRVYSCSLDLDSSDTPHITFTYYNWNIDRTLKYGKKTSSGWTFEDVDDIEYPDIVVMSDIAIDTNDKPHISYFKGNSPDYGSLYYAYKPYSTWIPDEVDSSDDHELGTYASIDLNSNNKPYISYKERDGDSSKLKCAYKEDKSWTIDDILDDHCSDTSIKIDANDVPHISFRRGPNPNLGYAVKYDKGWHPETVDSQGNVGASSSIDIDSNNYPHISYFEFNEDYQAIRYVTLGEGTNSRPISDPGGSQDRGIYDVLTNDTIIFNAVESFDYDGSIDEYRWDFDNDGIWDTDWTNSSIYGHLYNESGTYTVNLQVKDNSGAVDDESVIVQVNNIEEEFIAPNINDETDSEAVNNYDFSFIADVTDISEVTNVYVEYWYDSEPHFNVSIGKYEKDVWKYTITTSSGYQNLYYFISAVDSFSNWAETSIKSVDIIEDNPPYVPYNPFPEDESENVDIDTILSWTGGDPDSGDTVTYSVCIDTLIPPQIVVEEITETQYDPDLKFNTDYYWQIISEDNHGVTSYGPIWSFSTDSNDPPTTPSIDGPRSGSVETSYSYTFSSIDPDGDQVYYYIDWGDGDYENWFGPFNSGIEQSKIHWWTLQGDYEIKVKAKDIHDIESEWGTFDVSIPRFKINENSFILWMFERYPIIKIFLEFLNL